MNNHGDIILINYSVVFLGNNNPKLEPKSDANSFNSISFELSDNRTSFEYAGHIVCWSSPPYKKIYFVSIKDIESG